VTAAPRKFSRSLAAAGMGFAVGMLATPSFAQPQREEVDARVYQWRGDDHIAGIVDAQLRAETCLCSGVAFARPSRMPTRSRGAVCHGSTRSQGRSSQTLPS
jgi:hypothetical protein